MMSTRMRLEAQWKAVSDEPVPREWSALSAQTLPDVVRAARQDGPARSLVTWHLSGDELAGRVLLQAALPLLDRMSRRDPCHELGDYVSEFWLRLGRYPLERRPRRVLANLTLDTLKVITRDHQRRPRFLPEEASPPPPDRSLADVLHEAEELRLLAPRDARAMSAVYVEGWRSHEAGPRLGITAENVRWRCSRGVRTLALHAAELAA